MKYTINILFFCYLSVYSLRIGNHLKKSLSTNKKQDTSETATTTYDYGLIIDAGSSSSKIYTYKWPRRTENSVPQIEEISNFKVKPGIDKQKTKDDISNYMQKIFDFGAQSIEEKSEGQAKLNEVPIYFEATAGMRVLSQDRQEEILYYVSKSIIKSNIFKFKREFAKVIPGTDEAIYGWISVNYLNGVLLKNDQNRDYVVPTVGSLDMGGSSLEIAFIPKTKYIKEHRENVNLGHLGYNLYSYCFEGYGQDQAILKLYNYIADIANEGETDLINPCFNKGYSEIYTRYNKTYNLIGDGNIEKCYEYSKAILNLDTSCNTKPCSMGGIYQPKIDENQKFIAMNGFAFTAQTIGVNTNEYASPNDLKEKVDAHCSKTYDELLNEYGDSNEFLKIYCLTGNYYYALLVDAFGFKKENKNILFTTKINNFTPSWAFGSMAYEIGLLPFK